jgi:hypothetical protein
VTDFRFLLESVPNVFRRRPSFAPLQPKLFIGHPAAGRSLATTTFRLGLDASPGVAVTEGVVTVLVHHH